MGDKGTLNRGNSITTGAPGSMLSMIQALGGLGLMWGVNVKSVAGVAWTLLTMSHSERFPWNQDCKPYVNPQPSSGAEEAHEMTFK